MNYILICCIAFLGSGLTFFSGFGLGTILLPIFGLFFPIDVAVALTAIVHFLNNCFKLILVGKSIDKRVLLSFGLPSIVAALIGAWMLHLISNIDLLHSYHLFGREFKITAIKLIIALILSFFAFVELSPKLSMLQFDKKLLPIGGFLSGFFGGLSGIQGALRTAFLIRLDLNKERFIATGIALACLVDIARLSIYSNQIWNRREELNWQLIFAATLSAFAGAFLGKILLKKITIQAVKIIVVTLLLLFSFLLAIGIL